MRRIPTLISLVPSLLVVAVLGAACGSSSSGSGTDDDRASAAAGSSTSAQATSTTAEPTTVTTTAPPVPTTAAPTTAAPATSTTVPARCPEQERWTIGAQESSTMLPDELYQVRTGRHQCFDRLVFDINGVVAGADTVGFHVSYVAAEVTADGSGEPVPTAGDTALQVIVRAPIFGTSGHQPWRQPPRLHDDLVPASELQGWTTVRQVRYAGSFEGQTTIAVGLDAELPFRVGVVERDATTHLYVDIAHP